MEKQKPKKLISGLINLCVWTNQHEKDGRKFETESVTLDRRYKDQSGEWKSSQSFNVQDVPRLIVLLQKFLEEQYLGEPKPKEEEVIDGSEAEEVEETPKQQTKEQKIQVLTDQFMRGNITEGSFKKAIAELKK